MYRLNVRFALGLLIAIGAVSSSQSAQADFTVASGYDLFESTATFAGVNFAGVPLGKYDFGSGLVNTGNTDTIVKRLSPATRVSPGTAPPIGIELVALQLRTVGPADFGLGVGKYFLTLQSDRSSPPDPSGGQPSVGTMTITFANESGGTFTSSLDVFFDIRFKKPTGEIALSGDLVLSSQNTSWGRVAPQGAQKIPGVNFLLKGDGTTDQDFWPVAFTEQHPNGAQHGVTAAGIPEPSGLVLFVLGAVSLFGCRLCHRGSKAGRESQPA